MSLMSREKGKRFERRIADDLRRALPQATIRRSLQAHRAYEPDVVIEGDAPTLAKRLWLELTDSRAPAPLDKLAQAERDAQGKGCLEVVVWHRLGERSVQATMRLGTALALFLPDAPPHLGLLAFGAPVTLDWDHVLGALEERAARRVA
jgi:hypothetical protein